MTDSHSLGWVDLSDTPITVWLAIPKFVAVPVNFHRLSKRGQVVHQRVLGLDSVIGEGVEPDASAPRME
ncbi:hypothetical protein PM082_009740 [Marasmius tenuissimus]|nr:hypothetical protein PM082_009740 [Marasmius tenuissimus]